MKIEFKQIDHGSSNWRKAVELRENILRKPLGTHFTDEELKEEQNHVQIVGFIDDELKACAVLVPEGTHLKMQRVAVDAHLRNLNVGSEMMAFCEQYAKSEGYETVYCHARDSAVNFYLKNGYTGVGDYFPEDGIPHLKMEKRMANNLS